MHRKSKSQRGFSLIELLVVMLLAGVLFSMALFDAKRYANQALNGASSVMGFLKSVRAKALATTQSYTIRPSSTTRITTQYGSTCTDATQTTDTQMTLDLPAGAIFTDTSWALCYTTRGFSDTSVSIVVQDSSNSRTVQVVLGGGVRII